jgi:hypothetical protein
MTFKRLHSNLVKFLNSHGGSQQQHAVLGNNSNTNSTFTSHDISQEGQEVQSNNDGTNGNVIGSHNENTLEDSPKDISTNATTKDMKDTVSNGYTTTPTTESVKIVGVQSAAMGNSSEETTKG